MTLKKRRKRRTLRALLIDLLILLHTSHTAIPRNLAEPRRSFVQLIGVTCTYTSGNWLRPNRYAVVAVSHKVVVAAEFSKPLRGANNDQDETPTIHNRPLCIYNSLHAQRGPCTSPQRNNLRPLFCAYTIANIPSAICTNKIMHARKHTLCPIRHSVFAGLTYHFSKSFSSHFRVRVLEKSRKTVTTLPMSLVWSRRPTWPSSTNFCEVESGSVISARARKLTPMSYFCL
jgi:hypothetical protein